MGQDGRELLHMESCIGVHTDASGRVPLNAAVEPVGLCSVSDGLGGTKRCSVPHSNFHRRPSPLVAGKVSH